jgi:coenzyme F420-dependent glucose-6-phosphate dehydrogenase
MVTIGYMTDLGTAPPAKSMDYAVLAEQSGFEMFGASDHFYPWTHTGKGCAFAWVWLSAVAARTKKSPVGTVVTAPILRYNPAIIAQAFATMEQMFPQRVFLGLGAGEAINEVPAGCEWPSPRERVKRLEEAMIIIRSLWTKEETTFDGEFFKLKKTRLYSKPIGHIPMLLAAGKPKTLELAGKYADGLIAVPQLTGPDTMSQFEGAARRAGRDPSKLVRHLNFGVSFDADYDKAMAACRQEAATLLPFLFQYTVADPKEVESYSHFIDPKELAKNWLITTDPEDCIKNIEKYTKLGYTNYHVQSISPDEQGFIRMMGEKVIPHFKAAPR